MITAAEARNIADSSVNAVQQQRSRLFKYAIGSC